MFYIFNEIYSRYRRFMYTLCWTRFHDSAEAEIMFERTWDAVKKRPTYNRQKHNTEFATWLAGIAKNVAYDVDNQRIHGDIPLDKAIGLQAVDGLKTSQYLVDTAIRNIEGDISIDEAQSC